MRSIPGFILSLFGGLSFISGIWLLLNGLSQDSDIFNAFVVYYASGLILTGAVLLGFSRIISLLEDIEKNTRSPLQSEARETMPAAPSNGDQSAGVVISRGAYRGLNYTTHNDGSAVGRIGDKLFTWRSETDLKAWRDANPI